MKTRSRIPTAVVTAALLAQLALPAADKTNPVQLSRPDGKPADMTKPVKVFILLGQSNMLGMGDVGPETKQGTLEYLTKKEGRYPHLLDGAGKWSARSDVRYTFVMQSKGTLQNDWLTVKGRTIGPELQFGHIMGHVLDEPVLVLKACIGNRSLGWDYLPPGSERYEFVTKDNKGAEKNFVYAGYKDRPNSWDMDQDKGKATEPPPWIDKRTGKVIDWYAGKQYDDDVANAKVALADIGQYYPGAEKYEVAGFVWWQGHKDQGEPYASRYEQNLVRLIKSLRKDFNAPNAPFVLAVGCGNPGRTGFGLQIAEAQLAMNDAKKYPEFAGNVKCVESRDFWREVDVSPANQGYHYNRNAETYMEVGNALGWAMAELLSHNQ
jgi:alpha-galactosidase